MAKSTAKTTTKSKSKTPVVKKDQDAPMKSASVVDSSSDGESSSESDDSEDDLENVKPKKSKATDTRRSTAPSGSLPKYRPPPGMSPLEITTVTASSPFEWDALASSASSNSGLELWAIRVPKELKPSRLSNLVISAPKEGKPLTGKLDHKGQKYILRTAGSSKNRTEKEEEREEAGLVDSMEMGDGRGAEDKAEEGGEEMEGLRLLVPKAKEDGRLFVAPIPIKRRLLLTPDLTSTLEANSDPSLPSFLQPSENPQSSKRPQPTHLLKFRNHAYGYDTPGPEVTSKKVLGQEMEVEEDVSGQEEVEEKVEKKEKKRKTDKDESPAKAKKKAKKSKD
ncbi:hypothetical protein B9479_004407 [Cryptococcus floricola]|uniref:DNA-directed RNA polymerase I subunit RPA34 n=1 Tax=Cryptococcus floricola TaxID=2591691 RepID=A0A5D3AX69_9TREE|nr:hypothetical protein B9479_004407 [Cryptococcus floricola]